MSLKGYKWATRTQHPRMLTSGGFCSLNFDSPIDSCVARRLGNRESVAVNGDEKAISTGVEQDKTQKVRK